LDSFRTDTERLDRAIGAGVDGEAARLAARRLVEAPATLECSGIARPAG
jgi:hypothetical protein